MATINLAKAFKSRGHDVVVISSSRYAEKCGKIDFEGIKVFRFLSIYHEDRWRIFRSIYNPSLTSKVKEVILDYKPDVVLAHNIHMYLSFYSLVIAKRYVDKVFFVAHDIMSFYPGTFTEFIDPNDFSILTAFNYKVDIMMLLKKFRFRYFPMRNYLLKRWLNKIDGVVTVSGALRDALCQNEICVKTVIYNGIGVKDWNVLNERVSHLKNSLALDGKDCILFQGRLSGAKGGHLIIKAMKIVAESCPGSVLIVAGKKDSYAKKMMVYANDLGIADHIVFTDWLNRDDMTTIYNIASLIVVPSVCFDSFPNANLEAFACKKPVVATCFGGSREIVSDHNNGIIVNPFDVESLAKSIIYLLKNPDKAKEYGENGFKLVQDKFSIEKMSENYLNTFDL
jgi:glycosyltransferase involved in cell wall biosynthesis